jgi:hypothetical protein
MLPAVGAVVAILGVALLDAHRLPRLCADLLLHGAHDRIADEALRASRSIAGVGHQHRVLGEAMQADVFDRRYTGRRPAPSAAVLLLECLDPEAEDAARVREDALFLFEEGLSFAVPPHGSSVSPRRQTSSRRASKCSTRNIIAKTASPNFVLSSQPAKRMRFASAQASLRCRSLASPLHERVARVAVLELVRADGCCIERGHVVDHERVPQRGEQTSRRQVPEDAVPKAHECGARQYKYAIARPATVNLKSHIP